MLQYNIDIPSIFYQRYYMLYTISSASKFQEYNESQLYNWPRLLYHLQGKEGVLTSTQLLVIWGYRFDWIYSHALLIEHESTFVWNEDKLERLYNAYNSQYEVYTTIFREEWLLDDNTILKTACESSYRGFETEVIISEDEYLSRPIKPLWIDPNR
jgi:hypothetical protein